MQYQVTINIDPAGLKSIYGAEQVVGIIHDVMADPLPTSKKLIVWVAFPPLETNTLVWNDSYYIFATTDPTASPMVMNAQTTEPAQVGWLYTLADGFFTGVAPSMSNPTYSVANGMQDSMYFGLACDATANNVVTLSPLCAVEVPAGEQIAFTPVETVSIFQMPAPGSTSNNYGSPLAIQLTPSSPTATIGFNDTTNTFFLVSRSEEAG